MNIIWIFYLVFLYINFLVIFFFGKFQYIFLRYSTSVCYSIFPFNESTIWGNVHVLSQVIFQGFWTLPSPFLTQNCRNSSPKYMISSEIFDPSPLMRDVINGHPLITFQVPISLNLQLLSKKWSSRVTTGKYYLLQSNHKVNPWWSIQQTL